MTETLRAVSWPAIKMIILREVETRRRKIGSMLCPRCERGDLYYCVDHDGTVSAACTTEACVSIEPPSATRTPQLPMSWSARSAPKEES